MSVMRVCCECKEALPLDAENFAKGLSNIYKERWPKWSR